MATATRKAPRRKATFAELLPFLALTLTLPAALAGYKLSGLPYASFLVQHDSLLTVPLHVQNRVDDILFIPVGALVVILLRLTLGLRMLGPFRSILLASAFLLTGITIGVAFLAGTIALLLLGRPVLLGLRLPYFGRISLMLSSVAVLIVLGVLVGSWIGSTALIEVAFFPPVVVCLVGEACATTIRREGTRCGLWRVAVTTGAAIGVTALASVPQVRHLLLGYPELLLAEMATIVLVSRYCAWHLLRALNPQPRRRRKPHGYAQPRWVVNT